MFSLPNLDSTLSVLSAMITPAVMILATSSLILTTTNRIVRIVDRVREMLPEFEKLARSEQPDQTKRAMLFDDLGRATIRARLGQRALAQLYLGLGAFLATSISLGIVTFARLNAGWLPLLFGAIGVALLFSASILLIFESRIALASAYAEMDYIRDISGHLAPAEVHKTRAGRMFRLFVVSVLACLTSATDGLAQGTAAPSEALRVTWQPRQYGVRPAIEGQVQNDTQFWVSAVRLSVEGFDASGQPVGQTSTWTFGNIAPGGRGHFVVPPLPRATTYRITVTSFDRVSRQEPVSTQSP
jgi:hypothetical protein